MLTFTDCHSNRGHARVAGLPVMAQHKYDLTTVKTGKDGPKKHFPWYVVTQYDSMPVSFV